MQIGIDIGGTKIAGGLVHNGRVLRKLNVPTPRDRKTAVKQLREMVLWLSKGKRVTSIGIGVPGLFKGTRITRLPNAPQLDGLDLRRALGMRVLLENDARCFALAEARCGAAKGKRNVVGVILGTGVGTGIMIDGRLFRGAHGNAGEIGHTRMPSRERVTEFERLLSGPGIVGRHRSRGGKEEHPAKIWLSKSPQAKATKRETEQLLTTFLADIIRAFDPHVIVLGGSVSKLPLAPAVNKLLPAHGHKPIVKRSKLGDDAGIIGAALVAKGK